MVNNKSYIVNNILVQEHYLNSDIFRLISSLNIKSNLRYLINNYIHLLNNYSNNIFFKTFEFKKIVVNLIDDDYKIKGIDGDLCLIKLNNNNLMSNNHILINNLSELLFKKLFYFPTKKVFNKSKELFLNKLAPSSLFKDILKIGIKTSLISNSLNKEVLLLSLMKKIKGFYEENNFILLYDDLLFYNGKFIYYFVIYNFKTWKIESGYLGNDC